MKLLTILCLGVASAFASDYSPLTREYIDSYYNGDRRAEERELRQLLLEYLRDPQPVVIVIEQPSPTPRPFPNE